MILAAGLGTRLRPFTLAHPKALFEFEGKTLLAHAIEHLKHGGVSDIIINVHHFADQIVEYIHLNKGFDCRITFSDETGTLLETGGGLKKAAWYFDDDDDFIVRNVDIISDLDLSKMVTAHRGNGALATLAVRKRNTSRYFLFDDSMKLCGWENRKTEERILSHRRQEIGASSSPQEAVSFAGNLAPYAFSGLQVLSPAIFPLITEQGRFSLVSVYLRLSSTNLIKGYPEEGKVWQDVGTIT